MKTISFTVRNIRCYLREPGTTAISFLSVFIVLGLYLFVLSDIQITSMQNRMGNHMKDLDLAIDLDLVMLHWILAGLLCIPSLSVPLAILYFKVYDVIDNVQDDFFVTSSKRSNFIFGYVLAAWICGFIMTMLTFLIGELYIVVNGGEVLSVSSIIQIAWIIALTILAFTGFLFFVIMFLNSKSSLTLITTIFHTLIGFVAGLYVPIGSLSDGVETIIKSIPLAQAAALLRQIMMKDVIKNVFHDVPKKELDEFKQYYGMNIIFDNHQLTSMEIVVTLIIFGTVFYLSSIAIMKHWKK